MGRALTLDDAPRTAQGPDVHSGDSPGLCGAGMQGERERSTGREAHQYPYSPEPGGVEASKGAAVRVERVKPTAVVEAPTLALNLMLSLFQLLLCLELLLPLPAQTPQLCLLRRPSLGLRITRWS